MRTLHRHVISSYIGPFLMTFLIAVFVLFMQWMWKYIDDLIGKGLDTSTLTELFFYAALYTFPLALPLAILLASLMTFGNLGEHFELVALKSAGMSLQKIMMPLVIVAFLTSVGAFVFSNNVLPYVNLKMKSILYDIQQKKPALNIKEGVFYNGIDGYTIRIEKKDADGISCKGVMIYDQTQGVGNNKVSIAESGKLAMTADKQYLSVVLFNGINYEEVLDPKNENKHTLIRSKFKEQSVLFDLSGFKMVKTDEGLFKSSYAMLDISQINQVSDSLAAEKEKQISAFRKDFIALMAEERVMTPTPHAKDSLHEAVASFAPAPAENTPIEKQADITKRAQVVDMALNIVRSKQYYIESHISQLDSDSRPLISLSVEWHKKFTLSFACLILFFVGAPLGAIIRKGGLGMPVVVSVFIFILYYVITITGEKMSIEGALPAYIGMWIASAVTLPAGIFLTSKATSDSAVFDTEAYVSFFKKLLPKKK